MHLQSLTFETLNATPRYSGGVGSYVEQLLEGYIELAGLRDLRFGFLDTWLGDRHHARNFNRHRFFYGMPACEQGELLHAAAAFRCVYRSTREALPRSREIPIVVTHHDFIDLEHPRLFTQEELRTRVDSYRSFRRYSGFVVPSRGVADRLVADFGIPAARIAVIPHGNDQYQVDVDMSAVPQRRYLFAAGKMWPHKNWGRLFAACSQIREQLRVANLSMVFLSSDYESDVERFNAMRNRLDLDDLLEFRGHVTNAQLAGLFRAASGYVFPSLAEGFGMPLLEAQAAGLPLCISDLPVFRDIVSYSDYPARYFDPLTVKSIAAALSEFVREIETLQPQPFLRPWRRVAEEHLDFFDSIPLTAAA